MHANGKTANAATGFWMVFLACALIGWPAAAGERTARVSATASGLDQPACSQRLEQVLGDQAYRLVDSSVPADRVDLQVNVTSNCRRSCDLRYGCTVRASVLSSAGQQTLLSGTGQALGSWAPAQQDACQQLAAALEKHLQTLDTAAGQVSPLDPRIGRGEQDKIDEPDEHDLGPAEPDDGEFEQDPLAEQVDGPDDVLDDTALGRGQAEPPSATHFELEVRWRGELKPPPDERLTAYFRKAGLDFALVEQAPGLLFWVLLVERNADQMAADLDSVLGGEYLVEFEQERDNRLNCLLQARSVPAQQPAPQPAPAKTP